MFTWLQNITFLLRNRDKTDPLVADLTQGYEKTIFKVRRAQC